MFDATIKGFIAGIVVGLSTAFCLFLWLRLRIRDLTFKLQSANQQVEQLEQEKIQLQQKNEELQKETGRLEEQVRWLNNAESRLREAFQALAGEVLQRTLQTNTDEFIKRAHDQIKEIMAGIRENLNTHREELRGLIQPLESTLDKLDEQIRELERKRAEAYGSLERHLTELYQNSKELQKTTMALAEAFRKSPTVRGNWGEIQLRRIVELAGMMEHVAFKEQEGSDEKRPDLIIYLPNNGMIPVDAKVNLKHFLEAIEAPDDDTREQRLKEHAKAVRQTIQELSRKAYWEKARPEFVIMFIPHEGALMAAFQTDPDLLDEALKNKVIPTTPITLLALIKAIAYGWMQYKAVENAQKIANEAKELYERLCTCLEHITTLGRRLKNTVDAYNEFVGSLEHRVMPCVKRLKEMKVSTRELPQQSSIDDVQPRILVLPEAQIEAGKEC